MKRCLIVLVLLFSFQSVISQKSIAVYWDASYSMKDRNLEKELQLLKNYFNKYSDVEVHLSVFSNTILFQNQYSINDGVSAPLFEDLRGTIYDGGTSYAALFKETVDEYFVFTDGIENLDRFKPPTNKPIYVVTSIPNSNSKRLKLYADLSSGAYVYLTDKFEATKSVEKIKLSSSEVVDGFITGTVSGVEGYLSGANVVNKSTNLGTITGANGKYRIKAEDGNQLEFSYLGKKTLVVSTGKENVVDITLGSMDENLEEIILKKKIDRVEIRETSLGEINNDKIGYATTTINAEDIPETATDVGNAVIGKSAGLNLAMNQDLSQFKGRGSSLLLSEFGLIVLDGVPIDRSTLNHQADTGFLDPNNIESITHLKGLAATNIYGTQGNNGVLLIKTKLTAEGVAANEKKKNLGTTATYSGSAVQIKDLPDTPYINQLKTSKTIEEAYDSYLKQREDFGTQAIFYLDAYDYFNGWNNDLLAKRVLSNVVEIAHDNIAVLRALAYKFQSIGEYEYALSTFKRVLELAPKQSQSYRDLALANNDASNYKESLRLYNNIDKNRGVNEINTEGIKKTITNDAKNLITHQGSNLNTKGINPIYLKPIEFKARIIFEWNDFDAEFDLNIINPQKRFFTWSHTIGENAFRIGQEKTNGYALEEFYLTSADKGKWTFNIKYFGKTSSDKLPTFLKITVYENFGSPNETKKIKVIRLQEENIELTALSHIVN